MYEMLPHHSKNGLASQSVISAATTMTAMYGHEKGMHSASL